MKLPKYLGINQIPTTKPPSFANQILRLVFMALILSVLGGFFIFDTATHRVLFYIMLILGLYLISGRGFLSVLNTHERSLLLLTTLFLAYNTLSIFWTEVFDAQALIDAIKIPVFISIFVLTLSVTFAASPRLRCSIEIGFIGIALLSGLCLFSVHLFDTFPHANTFSARMSGFGRSENPNILSFMFGFATLVVLFGSWTINKNKCFRVAKGVLAFFFIFLIFLAKSRGAGLAILMAIAITACFSRSTWILGLCAIVLFSIGMLFFLHPDALHNIIQRADSYRFEIWKQAVPAMLEKPLFGHGIGSNFAFEVSHPSVPQQSSAHNVLLGTFLYGGMVGLSFLLALGFNALLRAARLGRDNQIWLPFSLLVFGGVAMQFSGHTLFLNLNHEWWYSWVPLAYIVALSTKRRAGMG